MFDFVQIWNQCDYGMMCRVDFTPNMG
jgi:hypothetical protein